MPRPVPPAQINFPGFEVGADDVLVDVGCGDGTVCAFASQAGAEVVGIDVDPESLRAAEAAMHGVGARQWRGVLSDCDPIPLPDASATVVVATEVLEHVESPERLAAELARIGRPGARYLVSVPDPASEAVLQTVAPEWYWRPPYHRRVFARGQLEGLLSSNGLEVVGRYSTGFYWSLWWAFRMALDAERGAPPPDDAPLLHHWNRTWEELSKTWAGERIVEGFSRVLPKSQVVIARKPGGEAGRAGHATRWKDRLRQGRLRVLGLDLQWHVRRARRAG